MLNVTIIGSNSASFAYGRHHSAQIVDTGSNLSLVDCGEGTQLLLFKNHIKLNRLRYIFISHLHGDHFLGLAGLLSSMHLKGRQTPIEIFGPEGLSEILVSTFRHSDTRINFPLQLTELAYREERELLTNGEFSVETFPLDHRINTHGYLFREAPKPANLIKDRIPEELNPAQLNLLKEGRDVEHQGQMYRHQHYTTPPKPSHSYAYCSDTKFMPELVGKLNGVDLLYHEATFMDDLKLRAQETYHSTTKEAATIAKNAGVAKLLIGHFSSRYKDLNPMLMEAKTVFENTELAIEGTTFTIGE